jgi:hypothetical protein
VWLFLQERLVRSTFLDFQPHSSFLEAPVIMERSKRMEYWDTNGKRYFDAIGGIFTSSLGHQHEPVVDALKKQLDTMCFAPPMHSISSVTLDFVEKLGEVTPGDLNFVKAYCSASEAMESAIKWTRSYHKLTGNPGKYKVGVVSSGQTDLQIDHSWHYASPVNNLIQIQTHTDSSLSTLCTLCYSLPLFTQPPLVHPTTSSFPDTTPGTVPPLLPWLPLVEPHANPLTSRTCQVS